MTEKPQEPEQRPLPQEPTQTTPKGLQIPVPKRGELMDAFRKLMRPAKKP